MIFSYPCLSRFSIASLSSLPNIYLCILNCTTAPLSSGTSHVLHTYTLQLHEYRLSRFCCLCYVMPAFYSRLVNLPYDAAYPLRRCDCIPVSPRPFAQSNLRDNCFTLSCHLSYCNYTSFHSHHNSTQGFHSLPYDILIPA